MVRRMLRGPQQATLRVLRAPPEGPPGGPPEAFFLRCTRYALIYARKPSNKVRLNASRTWKRRISCLGMSWRRNELIKITLADSGVARTVCMLVVYVNCFVQPTANSKRRQLFFIDPWANRKIVLVGLFKEYNRTAVRFFCFVFPRSHGAVRFSFYLLRIVRCGAVRFSHFQNHRVRCGAVRIFSSTVRCGKDYTFQESCGVVRCGYPLNSCFLPGTVQLSVHRS